MNSDKQFREIFEKSPIGIIFHDKKGNALNANDSALQIMGFLRFEDIKDINLFDNPFIEANKEKLLKEGIIRFQAPLDFEKIRDFGLYYPTKSGILFLDYTISLTDSGFLVQINDITKHKKIEEKLIQEHDIFETVIESSEGPIFSVDCNYRYTSFNLQHAKVMKNLFDADIEIGGNLLDYHTNLEDRKNAKLNIDKVFNGEIVNIESYAGDNPQNCLYFSIFHTPVRDSNGKVTGVAIYAQDLTERKKAEEALRESEEKFRSLYSSITEGVAIHDILYNSSHEAADYIITDVNPAYENITGLKRSEVTGKKASELYGTGKPPYMDIYSRVAESGEPANFEAYFEPMDKHFSIAVTSPNKGKFATFFIDITERKKAEEDLKESEVRYRSIIDNISDAYFRGDKEGKIIMASPSAARMYGYDSPREIIGLPTLSMYKNKEDRDFVLEELNKHGELNGFEVEAVKKDGTTFWVSQNAQFYFDNEGQIQGTEALVRDIAGRKNAENALRESKSQFQVLIQNLQSGVALVDKDGRFIVVNPSFLQMFGLDNELDILNVNSQDWSRWEVYGEDGKLLHVDEHPVRKAALNGKPVKNQLVSVRNPGAEELTWMLVSAEPLLNTDSSINMIICTYYDITERKKIEEKLIHARDDLEERVKERTKEISTERQRFYDVLETLPVMICLITKDHHISFANRAFRDRFGEAHGRHCYDYLFGFNEPCHWCQAFSVFETGKAHYWELETPDGSIIDVYNFPFTDSDGSPLILEMDIDVTEQKQNEKELRITVEELERSNQELQSFAYITSHDLQEPLRSIASYAQLIERRYKGQLDEDADEFLEFMVSGAQRMKQQIQGLLDYSRVGTQGGEFKEFNLEEALNHSLTNLRSAIEECDAEVTHESLPIITADENQITRVFQNLIGNALKFRREGITPKIHIKAQKEEKEYVFSVSDNGIGLEEQYSDRIFEVFKRLHAIGEYEGAGIGLAIVKRIIDRHHGRIWVESDLSVGSTFYFTIPTNK